MSILLNPDNKTHTLHDLKYNMTLTELLDYQSMLEIKAYMVEAMHKDSEAEQNLVDRCKS